MNTKKRIIIIGATSVIAEECARQWAKLQSTQFVLIGRNSQRLNRVASDLQIRHPITEVQILEADFLDPIKIQGTVEDIFQNGQVSIVLIAHGALPDQQDCQENLILCKETLEINGISPCIYAEAFAQHMQKQGHGVIALIGSVAGDRGRKSNYVYGAAKGLVARYTQGLQHRFGGSPVKIVLIKPGPTDTPMTASFKLEGIKMAAAADVAKTIIDGIAKEKKVIYVPRKWQLIMLVIQHIPSFIFNKLRI